MFPLYTSLNRPPLSPTPFSLMLYPYTIPILFYPTVFILSLCSLLHVYPLLTSSLLTVIIPSTHVCTILIFFLLLSLVPIPYPVSPLVTFFISFPPSVPISFTFPLLVPSFFLIFQSPRLFPDPRFRPLSCPLLVLSLESFVFVCFLVFILPFISIYQSIY